jgi:hypothetical protein
MAMDAALLHMDPKSPEAQVFYQLGGSSNQTAVGGPAPSPSGNITYYSSLFFQFVRIYDMIQY